MVLSSDATLPLEKGFAYESYDAALLLAVIEAVS